MKKYILLSEKKKKFNREAQILVNKGFVPHRNMVVSFRKGVYDDESFYIFSQIFVKK